MGAAEIPKLVAVFSARGVTAESSVAEADCFLSEGSFQKNILQGYLLRWPHLTLELIWGVHSHYLASIHDGDAVTETVGFLHIMGGVENGHPLVSQALNSFVDIVPRLGVYAHRRFIQKEKCKSSGKMGHFEDIT